MVFIQSELLRPIEPFKKNNNPEHLKVIENREPLVKVMVLPNRLYIKPMYYIQKIPDSIGFIYLRQEAYSRLKRALQLLPNEYSLILYDGFRPIQVQQAIYKLFSEDLKKRNPELGQRQLHEETIKFVALPSVEPLRTSPHITGGAIDLTLGDANGNELDLGTVFDEISDKSATRYFESHLTENEVALKNRRILYNCMISVGFNNYDAEWWHYDYGNVSWARREGSIIVPYGPILAEIQNNDIKEYQHL